MCAKREWDLGRGYEMKTLQNSDVSLNPNNASGIRNIATFLALIIFIVVYALLFQHLIAPRKDFYNELWGPAYLLVHGQSPYDTSSLNPNLPAAWFPMAIGFFFPLGWLTETPALQVWFVLNILCLCAIILWSQGNSRAPSISFALALFCFFFPPVLNHLYLGQISITVMLCLILTAFLIGKEQHWIAALFAALALSKPHLVVLPMLGLSLHEYRRGGWKSMFSFWGRAVILSLALCIPLFIAEPNWIQDAISSMLQNPYWSYPSLFVLYQRYFDGWEYVLWGLTFLFLVMVSVFLWRKLPLQNAMAWSMALAPLASPYVGSWDFVMLLPLFLLTFIRADWKRKAILAAGYVVAWLGMAYVQVQPGSDNHFFWWVPLWFVLLVTAMNLRRSLAATS